MRISPITIVSGLPRSGTSMMMQALSAGGMPVLTDHQRTADADNPRGYLEFERAKKLEHDKSWVPEAAGKAVKLISALLRHLPPECEYKILFMRRDIGEVLASQREMLRRRNAPAAGDDARMATLFHKHLSEITAWLAQQRNMNVLYVDYRKVVSDPAAQLNRVRDFLGQELKLEAMVSAVDESLHRQRSSPCRQPRAAAES